MVNSSVENQLQIHQFRIQIMLKADDFEVINWPRITYSVKYRYPKNTCFFPYCMVKVVFVADL